VSTCHCHRCLGRHRWFPGADQELVHEVGGQDDAGPAYGHGVDDVHYDGSSSGTRPRTTWAPRTGAPADPRGRSARCRAACSTATVYCLHRRARIGEVEVRATDVVLLGEALPTDHHLLERSRDPLLRQGQHIVPLGAHRLLDVPCGVGVAPYVDEVGAPRFTHICSTRSYPLACPPVWRGRTHRTATVDEPWQDAGHPHARAAKHVSSSWRSDSGLVSSVRKDVAPYVRVLLSGHHNGGLHVESVVTPTVIDRVGAFAEGYWWSTKSRSSKALDVGSRLSRSWAEVQLRPVWQSFKSLFCNYIYIKLFF
jgi:hypothetical protein